MGMGLVVVYQQNIQVRCTLSGKDLYIDMSNSFVWFLEEQFPVFILRAIFSFVFNVVIHDLSERIKVIFVGLVIGKIILGPVVVFLFVIFQEDLGREAFIAGRAPETGGKETSLKLDMFFAPRNIYYRYLYTYILVRLFILKL